jgi:hypothetical protein
MLRFRIYGICTCIVMLGFRIYGICTCFVMLGFWIYDLLEGKDGCIISGTAARPFYSVVHLVCELGTLLHNCTVWFQWSCFLSQPFHFTYLTVVFVHWLVQNSKILTSSSLELPLKFCTCIHACIKARCVCTGLCTILKLIRTAPTILYMHTCMYGSKQASKLCVHWLVRNSKILTSSSLELPLKFCTCIHACIKASKQDMCALACAKFENTY